MRIVVRSSRGDTTPADVRDPAFKPGTIDPHPKDRMVISEYREREGRM